MPEDFVDLLRAELLEGDDHGRRSGIPRLIGVEHMVPEDHERSRAILLGTTVHDLSALLEQQCAVAADVEIVAIFRELMKGGPDERVLLTQSGWI